MDVSVDGRQVGSSDGGVSYSDHPRAVPADLPLSCRVQSGQFSSYQFIQVLHRIYTWKNMGSYDVGYVVSVGPEAVLL